ncbi:MAG: choice-of-anchor D domain-containing protein, partial [Candidatus Kapabacteria bacterium]|nr:choice-of-anchor D domain-containing protein [Candidatus Kapabacteria bacterium]
TPAMFVAPNDNAATADINFGNQGVLIPSDPRIFTVTNVGSAPLTVTGASFVTGLHYSILPGGNGCLASPLPPSASCTIEVVFTPQAVAAGLNDTLTINSNGVAPTNSISVHVTGSGVNNAVQTVNPTALVFGPLAPTTPANVSEAQLIEVRNTGNTDMTLASVNAVTLAGTGFSLGLNTCTNSLLLHSQDSCLIEVRYTSQPTTTAVVNNVGTVQITSNGLGSPTVVNLTGSTAPNAQLQVLPASPVSFGTIVPNTTADRLIEVRNIGSTDLTLDAVTPVSAAVAPFSYILNSCTPGLVLHSQDVCLLQVRYSPLAASALDSQNITITSTNSSGGLTRVITVQGSAANAPVLFVTPSGSTPDINFGNQGVGTTSEVRVITASNTGNAPLTISAVAMAGANPGQFDLLQNNCTLPLNPGATCNVLVTFAPTNNAPAIKNAQVQFTSTAGNVSVNLRGRAIVGPGILVSPTSVSFTSRGINLPTASEPRVVEVTNNGTTDLILGAVSLAGANPAEFAILADDCSNRTIVAGDNCLLQVTFAPTAVGARTANLTIPSNIPGSPTLVPLSGTGLTGPALSFEPVSPLNLSSVAVGGVGITRQVRFYNSGNAPVQINSITNSNNVDFEVTNTCTLTTDIAPGDGCDFLITFKPQAPNLPAARSTTISTTDTAGGHVYV